MNDIETLNQMALQNKEIYLFPLNNILEISNLDKIQCKIKMLIDSGVANKMLENKCVGALIIADKEQFYKIKVEEKENEQ